MTHEMAAEIQERGPIAVVDMRRTSETLAADTFSNLAVSRTPRPSSNARRMLCTWNGVAGRTRNLVQPDHFDQSRSGWTLRSRPGVSLKTDGSGYGRHDPENYGREPIFNDSQRGDF